MSDVLDLFGRWQLDNRQVRERMYRAPTPRERERWHALWLLGRGLSAAQVAEALGRDAHTIGDWLEDFRGRVQRGSPSSKRAVPPALSKEEQAELKAAIQASPREAGIELSNWNWKVVRQFVRQHFGRLLSRGSCLNYLHRLGFAFQRPKKLLLKADDGKRAAFVAFYADLRAEAEASGAKIFFVDEAHFRADGDLRGKWVLRGEPALVGSTSPGWARRPPTTRRSAWRQAKWRRWR